MCGRLLCLVRRGFIPFHNQVMGHKILQKLWGKLVCCQSCSRILVTLSDNRKRHNKSHFCHREVDARIPLKGFSSSNTCCSGKWHGHVNKTMPFLTKNTTSGFSVHKGVFEKSVAKINSFCFISSRQLLHSCNAIWFKF